MWCVWFHWVCAIISTRFQCSSIAKKNEVKKWEYEHPLKSGINKLEMRRLNSSNFVFLFLVTGYQLLQNVRTLKSNVKIVANIAESFLFCCVFFLCVLNRSRPELLGVQTQVTIIRPFDLKFLNCFRFLLLRSSFMVVRKGTHKQTSSAIMCMYLCAKIQ